MLVSPHFLSLCLVDLFAQGVIPLLSDRLRFPRIIQYEKLDKKNPLALKLVLKSLSCLEQLKVLLCPNVPLRTHTRLPL